MMRHENNEKSYLRRAEAAVIGRGSFVDLPARIVKRLINELPGFSS
jgi:hypothetical protein